MQVFEDWKKAVEGFARPYEDALARLWDGWLRDARTLEGMGAALTVVAAVKERTDRALEDAWGRWRLASAADAERLHERLAAIEDALGRIEARLERAGPAGGAVAGAGARGAAGVAAADPTSAASATSAAGDDAQAGAV